MNRILLSVALACAAVSARAEGLNLLVGGFTHHVAPAQPDGKKWNEVNELLGLELRTSPAWAWQAFRYHNSEFAWSNAVAVQFTPWEPVTNVFVGAEVGAVNGYAWRTHGDRSKVMPLAGVTLEWRAPWVTAQLTIIPGVPNTDTRAKFMLGFKAALYK